MNILVLNAGSSSLKAAVINTKSGERLVKMAVQRIDSDSPDLQFSGEENRIQCPGPGHDKVLEFALPLLLERLGDEKIGGVGHRVVHGGEKFSGPARINDEVIAAIELLFPIAPLHNPPNLAAINMSMQLFPELPHIAVFDTAFHQTLPNRAKHYALPKALTEKYNLRRYGFHGTSHAFVAHRAAEYLGQDLRSLKLITCHLGNGCSMAAIEYGRSVETTMGMTPLEGLVMGTRSGDLDPGIILSLLRDEGLSVEELDNLLNKESGLKGLSGVGNDMRDVIDRSTKGDEDARLALHVFTHRIRKYIGAYAAVMDGVDAIVFTGGIGENSPVVRLRSAQRLDYMGVLIDEDANRDLNLDSSDGVGEFSRSNSRVKLLAISTDEQLEIARQARHLIKEKDKVNKAPAIPIAISARHIHLTQEVVEKLFGEGYELTERNPLSQPGQFACNETVTLAGPKNQIEKVRILGPTRSKNQVEISRTDEFFLGIDAPVRASGHIENTPGITLVGPKGTVNLKEGLICAWRHIHMTPEDAENFGVENKDIVDVKVVNEERSLTFGNVLIRVSPKYKLEMHIDTDEANAAEITPGTVGALIGTEDEAFLQKRKVK